MFIAHNCEMLSSLLGKSGHVFVKFLFVLVWLVWFLRIFDLFPLQLMACIHLVGLSNFNKCGMLPALQFVKFYGSYWLL